MLSIPKISQSLLVRFSVAFTEPTFRRFVVLVLAAIVTTGRHNVSNVLRTAGRRLAPGHPSSYHRVLSTRRWLAWRLGRVLATLILEAWIPEGIVRLAGDDTAEQHRGAHVYGKARHRDAVRSSHSHTVHLWGHKWVVLAFLVDLPFTTRRWALPVLVALYRAPKCNENEGRRHKTPPELMQQLLATLIHWFPERKFLFAGDGGFGTHQLASFARRHRRHLVLVSRFYPEAALYEPAPKHQRRGRPRKKGAKLPGPSEVVKTSRRLRKKVAWYGGGSRRVEVVSNTGHWYRAGQGAVRVRWVFVHDLSGTHRDEYFFTTDPAMSATQIIEAYTNRWSIETTFQEMREWLGFGTTRGWCKKTVLRAAPSLFGLYSLVVLLYRRLPVRDQRAARITWPSKSSHVTYSEVITAVRRWLWIAWVFETHGQTQAFQKLKPSFRRILLYSLAPAA